MNHLQEQEAKELTGQDEQEQEQREVEPNQQIVEQEQGYSVYI